MCPDVSRVPFTRPQDALGSEANLDLQNQARDCFLAAVAEFRVGIHEYCTRMTGSALDGEDVVQEALAAAYFKLGQYLASKGSMRSWLFRIAHNKCIDFVRQRRGRSGTPTELDDIDEVASAPADTLELAEGVRAALAFLVNGLPPRERACLILKDVLSYSLTDIADLTGTSLGGVKSALHRARLKVSSMPTLPDSERSMAGDLCDEDRELVALYAEHFNAHDWDGLEKVVSADARLEVVGLFSGEGFDSMRHLYLGNYALLPDPVILIPGKVDGKTCLVGWQRRNDRWVPVTAVLVRCEEGRVVSIRDYLHVEYALAAAVVEGPPPRDDARS